MKFCLIKEGKRKNHWPQPIDRSSMAMDERDGALTLQAKKGNKERKWRIIVLSKKLEN